MNNWWKRSISFLLALVMILGCVPSVITVAKADDDNNEEGNLGNADGIIWLTKNEADDNASDRFISLVKEKMMMDDWVREAVGADKKAKVVFKDVNIGDPLEVLKNMSVIESMQDEMKKAITDKQLLEFIVGGEKKWVAFRSLESLDVEVGDWTEENGSKIYVDHARAPKSPEALQALVEAAVNNAKVKVKSSGKVEGASIFAKTTARYEGAGLTRNGAAITDWSSWLAKWPVMPQNAERKLGTVSVTFYGAEYDHSENSKVANNEQYKKTVTVDVILRDKRATITYNAKTADGTVMAGYGYSYEAYVGDATKKIAPPTFELYDFVKWEPAINDKVTGDVTYSAIVKPKNDSNNNGTPDEQEVFNVVYMKYPLGYAGENVVHKCFENVPYGKKTEKPADLEGGQEGQRIKWVTENGQLWQDTVTGDVVYYPEWTDAPTITGVLKYRDKTSPSQELTTYYIPGVGYKVEDPRWVEDVDTDNGEYVVWYYRVPVGTAGAEDLNCDDVKEEIPFVLVAGNTSTDGSIWNADKDLELICEKFIKDKDQDYAQGSYWNPIYVFTFETAYGAIKVENVGELNKSNYDSVAPIYAADMDQETGEVDLFTSFIGWEYTKAADKDTSDGIYYYTATADLKKIQSSISLGEDLENFFEQFEQMENKVIFEDGELKYIWGKAAGEHYEATVEISGMTADGNYLYGADTDITISPVWEYDGKIRVAMVASIEEVKMNHKNLALGYDDDYRAYKAASPASRAAAGEGKLEVAYKFFKFETKDATLEAGQAPYNKETVYKAVMSQRSLGYDPALVTVEYLARNGEEVEIDLYRLYDLFTDAGLGMLLEAVPDLPKTYNYTLTDKWLSVDEVVEEKTAQEVADAYLKVKFDELKESGLENFGDFIETTLAGLVDELEEKAVYQLGSAINGRLQEDLRITYKSDRIYGVANKTVSVVDNRDDATLTFIDSAISGRYHSGIGELIKNNVVLSVEDGEFSILDENGNYHDYSAANAGTYTGIKAFFKGNSEYKPVVSADSFTLTVEKVEPVTVDVDEMITEIRGADYYDRAAAKVNTDAPVVQIIAGIAMKEFKLDESFALADDKVVVDAWVKLPETYIDLLRNFELDNLNGIKDGIEVPSGTIRVETYYEQEHLEDTLQKYIDSNKPGADAMQKLLDIIALIPDRVINRLGLDDINYTLRIRLDNLEDEVYPTEPGFYVNYAATVSRVAQLAAKLKDIEYVDPNYGVAEDYGFIILSPMVPIPNKGGIQLYDGKVTNAQNVFEYRYTGEKVELEVALNGVKLENAEPFYYGLTTRFDQVKEAPSKPGVYIAGYNYTTTVYNEDTKENEVRRLGSDSAIIVIMQPEADLTITGGTYEYDSQKHFADIVVTDKNGNEINNAAVTIISGTVNVNGGTNVTANDLYGTVNIDFPEGLTIPVAPDQAPVRIEDDWNDYREKILKKAEGEKIIPSDLIAFLEYCGERASKEVENAAAELKELAVDETVNKVLNKINGTQDRVDISSDNLIAKVNRAQDLMEGCKKRYDILVAMLEPLKKLDDNVSITFYDLKTEAKELPYEKTGVYLYMGLITDPDYTIGAGKGLVIIHSDDDYIMQDTHVPYDGQPHDILIDDDTFRGDITAVVYGENDGVIAIDRLNKTVHLQVEDDVAKIICDALREHPGWDLTGESDVRLGTVYTKAEGKIDGWVNKLTEKVVNYVKEQSLAAAGNYEDLAEQVRDKALAELQSKMDNLTSMLFNKLQQIDRMEDGTRFYINGFIPADLGTYEVTYFDFNVNEVNFQLDSDMFGALNAALDKVNAERGTAYKLVEGSDGYILNGYGKAEEVFDILTDVIFKKLDEKATAAINKLTEEIKRLEGREKEDALKALDVLKAQQDRIDDWANLLSSKLQIVDGLNSYTRIVINGKLPVEVGTYNFFGYNYDVSATRGKLIIEPIRVQVSVDANQGKEYGTVGDPLKTTVRYFSIKTVYDANTDTYITGEVDITDSALIAGAGLTYDVVCEADAVNDANAAVGTYKVTIENETIAKSKIYKLLESIDGEYEVVEKLPEEVIGTIEGGVWMMDLDSVVYLHYYPKFTGFSDTFDFATRAGVILWTGDSKPTGADLQKDFPNTLDCKGLVQDVNGDWCYRSDEFFAKNIGDMIYIRPYIIDNNGEYVYMKGGTGNSPARFCYYIMSQVDENGDLSEPEGKRYVCAALLEYGASAQKYFNYKTDALVTTIPAQYSIVNLSEYDLEYREDYLDGLDKTEHIKNLNNTFIGERSGVVNFKSSLDLQGAIRFVAGYNIDESIIDLSQVKKMQVLFWSEKDIANLSTIAYEEENYTSICDLVLPTGETADPTSGKYLGEYIASSSHIVCKYLGDSVYYVCRIEMNDGTVYRSQMFVNSPENLAYNHVAESTGQVVDVSKRIIVYGEKAYQWFEVIKKK